MVMPYGRDVIFALDIGTRTVIGIVCKKDGANLKIIAESIMEHDSRSMIDGQVHDIDRVARVVDKVKEDLETKVGFPLKDVAIAAAGRTLKTKCVHAEQDLGDEIEIDSNIINGLELSGVNQAGVLVQNEAGKVEDKFYCVGYSVVSYYLNGYAITNLLDHKGKTVGVDVLATFLPYSVVNSLYKVLEKCSLNPICLTLEPIAALEAIVPENIRLLNIALIDIGAGTSDIAITRKGTISAYGMVSVAGDEVTETVAEHYLLDFNTAENIKRTAGKRKKVSFRDVTGVKVTVQSSEVLSLINEATAGIAHNISEVVLNLNGDSPRALFLVGGGSQTPGLIDALSRELNVDKQRIALKKRAAIPNIEVCGSLVDGPEGVTVVGIAIVAFKKVGHDFISLYINNKECRLFNSGELTVKDVLGLIGYDPSLLIGRSGRSVKFTWNGEAKRVPGSPAEPPEIYVNEKQATMDTIVKGEDYINIKNAVNGKDACITIEKFAQRHGFDLSDKIIAANGNPVTAEYIICDGDSISITVNHPGDGSQPFAMSGSKTPGDGSQPSGSPGDGSQLYSSGAAAIPVGLGSAKPSDRDCINVTVNGNNIVLPGRDHIFVDIFNAYDIDLSKYKGKRIEVTVNGRNAEYSQPLFDGDVIEII